jgi:hypothetical protein
MLDAGWNVGAYGFYDRRHTEEGSNFNQATFGAEALSVDWDLRANVYHPFGDKANTISSSGGSGPSSATLVGSSIIITTPGNLVVTERALPGFDGEIGWRVPVFGSDDTMQLRAFAGGFYFDDSQTDAVTGPRFRVNLEMAELNQLWNGARVDIGAEMQHDDVRDTQTFATLRLRIPLQDPARETTLATLSPIERRMTDPIVRDIDVVSGNTTTGSAATTEEATAFKTNPFGSELPFVIISDADTTGADLPAAVAAAGEDGIILLAGTFNTTSTVVLQEGQWLLGGIGGLIPDNDYETVEVFSATGRTANFTLPTATISANSGISTSVIGMADDSIIQNITITTAIPNVAGISFINVTDATAEDNAISMGAPTFSIGIYTDNSTNLSIDNNYITGNVTGADITGLSINNNTGTQVSRNTVVLASSGGNVDGIFLSGNLSLELRENNINVNSGVTGTGINGDGAVELYIFDNIITATTYGLDLSNNTALSVIGNELTSNTDVVLSNNTFNTDPLYESSNNITNGSTACSDLGGNTGIMSFTNSTNCPSGGGG